MIIQSTRRGDNAVNAFLLRHLDERAVLLATYTHRRADLGKTGSFQGVAIVLHHFEGLCRKQWVQSAINDNTREVTTEVLSENK